MSLTSRKLPKLHFTFRPVIRRTLKPGAILWKMFLYALWVAVWPGLGHDLAHLVVQDFVPGGVEVEAYERGEECQRQNS